MLIRDLTIKGYRCFEDFSMDGLTRVNLLVGNNNSGKTSFLEAVYLLVNQPSFSSKNLGKIIKEIFENRNEFSQHIENHKNIIGESTYVQKNYFMDRLFYGYDENYDENKGYQASIYSQKDDNISTDIISDDTFEYIGLFYSNNQFMFRIDEEETRVVETFFKFNAHFVIYPND